VERFHGAIDTAMNSVMTGDDPPASCALVVVGQNRIATINAYGVPFAMAGTLLDPGTPAIAQTRLYVGSISKTLTALAMLKLAEEAAGGGLASGPPVSLLDRPLVELYPPVAEVPEWSGFTPRTYLAHASGVPKDPLPFELAKLAQLPAAAGPHPGIHPRHAFVTYRNTMPRIAGFEQQFDASYSNIGYSLVGAAIDWQTVDDVAGSEPGYEPYVFDHIALNDGTTTEPTMISLCLGAPWRAPQMANLAQGFAGTSTPLPAPDFGGWEGPSGGWTMTIGDLGRLIIAINTTSRISATSRAAMLADVATDPLLDTTHWGLGVWRTTSTDGDLRYGKGGDITGFTSDFIAYRDAGVGAGIVCNRDGMDHPTLRGAIRDIIDPCLPGQRGAGPAYCTPPI